MKSKALFLLSALALLCARAYAQSCFRPPYPGGGGGGCFAPTAIAFAYRDGDFVKPGFGEYCPGHLPIIKHYLNQIIVTAENGSQSYSDANFPSQSFDCSSGYNAGFRHRQSSYSGNVTTTSIANAETGDVATTYSASLSASDDVNDLRVLQANNCDGYHRTITTNKVSMTCSESISGSDPVWTGSYSSTVSKWIDNCLLHGVGCPTGWEISTDTSLIIGPPAILDGTTTVCTPTHTHINNPQPSDVMGLIDGNESFTSSGSSDLNLSNEYTDAVHNDKVMRIVNAAGWSGGYFTAKREWSESHEELYLRQLLLSVTFDSPTAQQYTVYWKQITVSLDTGLVTDERTRSKLVQGTPPSTTVDIVIDPPAANGVTFVGDVWVCSGAASGPQSPSSSTTSRSPGCCGGSDSGMVDGQVTLAGGPSLVADLGRTLFGYSAGQIVLNGAAADASTATPSLLSVNGAAASTVIITDANGTLRQAKSDQRLAHVEVVSTTSYKLHLFGPVSASPVGGIYPTNGLTELSCWTVTAPDAASGSFNRIQIAETKGGVSKMNEFIFTPGSTSATTAGAAPTWVVTRPGGLLTERQWSYITTGAPEDPQQFTQVYETINPATGAVLYHSENVYNVMVVEGEDSPTYLELAQTKIGTGANALVTSYQHGTAAYSPIPGYRPVTLVTDPYGTWTEYQYNLMGTLVTRVTTGVMDSTYASFQADPDHTFVHQWTYEYDSGGLQKSLPINTKEFYGAPALCISQTKRVITADPTTGSLAQVQEYRLHAEDSDGIDPLQLDDPRNLLTTTVYIVNPADANYGMVKSVTNPDGTIQLFSYSSSGGNRITTVKSGLPNAGPTDIVAGTTTTTTINPAGQTVSVVQSETANGLTVTTSSRAYDNPDVRGRMQRAHDNLANLDEWTYYDCCMLSSTVNREGTTTSYGYDAMNRLFSTTTAGITTFNYYDGAGNLAATVRQGSDGSVTNMANAYDDAGRLIYSTNALGVITSYSETLSSGYRVSTTLQAVGTTDASTRVERYYRDGQLAENWGSAGNPTRYLFGLVTDGAGGPTVAYSSTIKLTADQTTTGTNEWSASLKDFFGRPYKILYADATSTLTDNPYALTTYDQQGRMVSQSDPDRVVTLSDSSNPLVSIWAQDLNANSVIDYAGPDRITKTVRDVANEYSTTTRRSTSYEWQVAGVNAAAVLSVTSTSVDGKKSWTVTTGATNPSKRETIYLGGGLRVETNTAPNGSYLVMAFQDGRLRGHAQYGSDGISFASSTNIYDGQGRLWKTIDARNGTTLYSYNNADQVVSVTTPSPGAGMVPQVTTTQYDNLGRVKQSTQPDGTVTANAYYPSGLLQSIAGGRTYPMSYTYDAQGRTKTLVTWQNYPSSGQATTTWNYDAYRGWISNKRYQDGKGPDYTYSAGGRMKTRQWARTGAGGRVTTTWSYGSDSGAPANLKCGDIWTIAYQNDPQNTPTVTFAYDRCGHTTTETRTGGTALSRTFTTMGMPLVEAYSAGPLNGLGVTLGYDSSLRRQSLTSKNGTSTLASDTYAYDNASRLLTVGDGTYSGTYAYLANSSLPGTITYQQDGVTRMITTRQFDYLNRLQKISSQPSGSGQPPLSFTYRYDSADQRTRSTTSDGGFWDYRYDSLGQVIAGKRFWNDGSPVAGQQFEYAFDTIGNRKSAKMGGDANGLNQKVSTYVLKSNGLNQYDSRTVPGFLDVVGVAQASIGVTVNTATPDTRKGEYFWKSLTVNNTTAPVWTTVNVTVPGGTAQTGTVVTPPATQTYAYDNDGNLTGDGIWSYTWDAENRLLGMQAVGTVPGGAPQQMTFEYDSAGRRIRKTVVSSTGTVERRFLYDGRNLAVELDGSNAVIRTYLWGNDLGGDLASAGGVGGLIAWRSPSPTDNAQFIAYDGNGNVAGLVDGASGNLTASYEYGPFGETIRASGAQAKTNPIRFSSKYQDDESDYLYYGCRFYLASTGRWISRDPTGEYDGPNIYLFVNNCGLSHVDSNGLWGWESHYDAIEQFLSGFSAIVNGRVNWGNKSIYITYDIKDGNDNTDGTWGVAHTGGLVEVSRESKSYIHSMRAPYENQVEAAVKTRAFIEEHIRYSKEHADKARAALDSCVAATEIHSAFFELGVAQHPVSDAISPAHRGFQEWEDPFSPPGTESFLRALVHAYDERALVYRTYRVATAEAMHQRFDDLVQYILK